MSGDVGFNSFLYKPADMVYVCVPTPAGGARTEFVRVAPRQRTTVRARGANAVGNVGTILIIIAALGLQGNVDAHPLDGPAQAARVARRRVRRVEAADALHPRARRRHDAGPHVSSGTRPRRTPPTGQPAHLVPQPEDIPPVKPPKKTLPPADKRNPLQ